MKWDCRKAIRLGSVFVEGKWGNSAHFYCTPHRGVGQTNGARKARATLARWMPVKLSKGTTQVNHTLPVQSQSLNGGAANRRQPNQVDEIGTPGEVGLPRIETRMIESLFFPCRWVKFGDRRRLASIASHTGKGEVVPAIAASFDPGNDVIDRKGIGRIGALAEAILTTVSGLPGQ